MEKCLLDILEEERDLIREIDTKNIAVRLISDRRVELLMRFTCEADYEYERHYLAHLQEEIDRKNEEKFELQRKLAITRRELASYIKALLS